MIEFDTDKTITNEQFKVFKKKLESFIDDFEMMVFDAASDSGFEADNVHPVFLEDLQCEFDE